MRRIIFGLSSLALLSSGCASLSGARPLEPGQHEIGATFGGGMVLLGGSPIPLPNLIVQGRSGVAAPLDRPLDVNYGINLTGLPFGVLHAHVGASWLLAHQNGAIPAVSFTDRIWFGTNAVGLGDRVDKTVRGWGANQFEVDVSWKVKEQLVYVGLAQYLDFVNPALTLTPVIGATFDADPKKPGGVRLHLESRWYAINERTYLDTVKFAGWPQGAFGVNLGVSYVLGVRK
jgi:hypothetical protein